MSRCYRLTRCEPCGCTDRSDCSLCGGTGERAVPITEIPIGSINGHPCVHVVLYDVLAAIRADVLRWAAKVSR